MKGFFYLVLSLALLPLFFFLYHDFASYSEVAYHIWILVQILFLPGIAQGAAYLNRYFPLSRVSIEETLLGHDKTWGSVTWGFVVIVSVHVVYFFLDTAHPVVFFLLPLVVYNTANVAALLNKFLPLPWSCDPIDGSLLGKNKTWGGVFWGLLVAFGVFHLYSLFGFSTSCMLTPYIVYTLVCVAFFGDVAESYFKRRACIPPGEDYIPWDHVDWMLPLVFVAPALLSGVYLIWFFDMLLAVIIAGFIHYQVNYVRKHS